MIKNKTHAIILAVLTFILGSIALVSILFLILGYPLSSIPEHQLYVFTMILISALLASRVYGRGSKERASRVVQLLEKSFGISVKENVTWRVLRTIDQLPPFVVNKYISLNINAVNEFDDKIKVYKKVLSEEDLFKIKKIVDTPVDKLQKILYQLYQVTDMEQFKILSEPDAKEFITMNLQELKKILFDGLE